MLRYEGAARFRQRLVLATLSGRPVRIDNIRTAPAADLNGSGGGSGGGGGGGGLGLREHEASFLRLLEKVVNGCEVRINETGTAIRCCGHTPSHTVHGTASRSI